MHWWGFPPTFVMHTADSNLQRERLQRAGYQITLRLDSEHPPLGGEGFF